MAYEKSPSRGASPQPDPLPEFSKFVENVRFSQVIQEKIKDISRNLQVIDRTAAAEPESVSDRLKKIDEQMAELIRIRDFHLNKD